METLGQRVRSRRIALNLSQSDLAERANVSQSTIAQIEVGRNLSTKFAPRLASALGVTLDWLMEGRGTMEHIPGTFIVRSVEDQEQEVLRIPYYAAKGSCGNGVINFDESPKGFLVKEAGFFAKYGVPPDQIIAVYADGNSNAEYIVDGDICLFDRRKTEPRSGKIFLVQHPDGLLIKVLRRRIDGSWVLESKNPDKAAYPDEVIPPGQADLLHICGEFFYRQGG